MIILGKGIPDLFLRAVEEREIKNTVNKCKDKMHTDFNETDHMTVVKGVLGGRLGSPEVHPDVLTVLHVHSSSSHGSPDCFRLAT